MESSLRPRSEDSNLGPLSIVVSRVCSNLCRPAAIKGTTSCEEKCFGSHCSLLVDTACYIACVSSGGIGCH